MDGLECIEINKSALERTLRIDSEFYKQSAIQAVQIIKSHPWETLVHYVNVSDGNHMGISDRFIDEGVPYYRGQDANHFFIENSNPICIDEKAYSMPVMHRSHLAKGDVLLSIVGTIGSLSLVYSTQKATCSCKLAILRPKKKGDAEVIAAFLKGKYGQAQIQRHTRGAVQMGLILEDMDQIIVPHFGDDFSEQIKHYVDSAYSLKEQSRQTYNDAQLVLEKTLGISAVEEAEPVISVESFVQSFGATGRLDAEYYRPAYKKIEAALYKYDPDTTPLSTIAEYIFTGEYAEEYYSKGSRPSLQYFLRGTDICDGYIEADDSICINPSGFSKFVSCGDILTGRVGTIGKFGVVDESLNGALCSDNILCFHLPKIYHPNVYALYFNNPIIKQLITRLARGSVQQRLNQETLREVLVPLIKEDVQILIDHKVSQSFTLREKADRILDTVTQAVEVAVEQGETVAVAWLKDRILQLEAE